ncbi:hypothetical protein HZH66_012031 [Vespula vulgaris]|uniref:Uncharacterized protein n=1 Tax=Vespula vulgaris TaxID=7454 RepID=A0A834MTS4_VESVU|nr:hypothetical protein HZH66_012031 [Vespula vulgaris]
MVSSTNSQVVFIKRALYLCKQIAGKSSRDPWDAPSNFGIANDARAIRINTSSKRIIPRGEVNSRHPMYIRIGFALARV